MQCLLAYLVSALLLAELAMRAGPLVLVGMISRLVTKHLF